MPTHEPLLEQDRIVSRVAEQQMRRWALGLEVRKNLEHEQALAELISQFKPFVAISRECGAGGSEIAAEVGRRLGWPVLDRTLFDALAEQLKTSPPLLEHLDETSYDWWLEVFGKWLDSQVVTQSEYVVWLGRIVLLAAQHASTLFVGRGAHYFLPRQLGLLVQITAPLQQRIERVMQLRHLDRERAKLYIQERDRGRADFVRTYFHRDVSDSHEYDLVLNRENLPFDDIAELITAQAHRNAGRKPEPIPIPGLA